MPIPPSSISGPFVAAAPIPIGSGASGQEATREVQPTFAYDFSGRMVGAITGDVLSFTVNNGRLRGELIVAAARCPEPSP